MWFRPENAGGVDAGILTKGYSEVSENNMPWYLLAWNESTDDCISPSITFYLRASAGVNAINCKGGLPINTWYHVANVYDPASATLSMYINNVLEDTVAGVAPGAYGTNSSGLVLGRFFGTHTQSSMDDVRIWNRALSPGEVNNLYLGNTSGLQSGLVGHWMLVGAWDTQDVAGAWTAVSDATYNIYLCADAYNVVSESDETAASNCRSIQIVIPPECSDGVDNDGDGNIDYPSDPGCTSASDNAEQSAEASVNIESSVATVPSGESTSVSWTVSNVTGCTVLGTSPPGDSWSSGAVGGTPQVFMETTGPITQMTTYTLLCTDYEGESVGAQVIIRVRPIYEET